MTLKRTTTLAAFFGWIVLTGATAQAQLLGDLQLFAPPKLDAFGGGRQPSEGFFFAWDQLYWHIQSPDIAKVGDDGQRYVITGVLNPTLPDPPPGPPGPRYTILGYDQSSTADTSGIPWNQSWGERFEMGWTDRHQGLMVSVTHLQPQSHYLYLNGADVFFNDPNDLMVGLAGYGSVVVLDDPGPPPTFALTETPIIGPLPVTFSDLRGRYRIDPWSVEVNYLRRSHAFHHGGFLELMAGVRYMEFNDRIEFEGLGGTLDGSFWRYEAENHIIGPQIAARYFKLAGRWMLNAEGRFTAGFNSQNIHHHSRLNVDAPGTEGYPGDWTGANVTSAAYQNEWCPLVELRVELRYLVTRAINLRVGWTGTWMDGIVRSPSVIEYSLPNMAINMAHNREDLFMHGLTFGVDLNR